MTEPEYRWITNQRQGRCTRCHELVQQGSRCLWSLLDKQHIYCADCAGKFGYDDEPRKGAIGDSNTFPSMTTTTESSYEAIKNNSVVNGSTTYDIAFVNDDYLLFVRRAKQ